MESISDAIQQKHFESPQQKVLINLLYTSSWARHQSTTVLRPFKLTWQQYNLMRILRGQKGKPASMRLLQERMLDPQSNASRLVDKLELKKWVERATCGEDRRQVRVRLTDEGSQLLEKASEAIRQHTSQIGKQLTEEQLHLLSQLLDTLREP